YLKLLRYFIFIMSNYLKLKYLFTLILGLGITFSFQGQTSINITAVLNDSTRIINIQQEIVYQNTGDIALPEIYLNDWANSFRDKETPLAKRFAEDYIRRFHFAAEEERGYTKIYSITDE